jgi:hypothetical protein
MHKVTPETCKAVENAAGMGLPLEMVAALLDISEQTLRKRYKKHIEQGKAKACFGVATMLYTKATRHQDVQSAIWWEKTRTGLREPRDPVTIQTAPGSPLQVSAVSREELTAEILREIRAAATVAQRPAIEHEPKANGHAKP